MGDCVGAPKRIQLVQKRRDVEFGCVDGDAETPGNHLVGDGRQLARRLPPPSTPAPGTARLNGPIQPAKDVIRFAGECLFPGWGSP